MSEKTKEMTIKKIYILKDKYNWSHSEIAKKLNIGKSTVGYYLLHRELYDKNYKSKTDPVDPVEKEIEKAKEVSNPVEVKTDMFEIPQTSKFAPNNYSSPNPNTTILTKVKPIEFS